MAGQPLRGGRPFLARRFESEAGYRRRVEVAERLGIPPSQLDGREPVEETRHVYDRRGRLIRSVTTREPRWTEQDRAELLALALYRDGLCPNCGRPLTVCTSVEGSPGAPEFDVKTSLCRATRAITEAKNALTEDGKKPLRNAEAWLFGTVTREV